MLSILPFDENVGHKIENIEWTKFWGNKDTNRKHRMEKWFQSMSSILPFHWEWKLGHKIENIDLVSVFGNKCAHKSRNIECTKNLDMKIENIDPRTFLIGCWGERVLFCWQSYSCICTFCLQTIYANKHVSDKLFGTTNAGSNRSFFQLPN